jgi:hypothetical protein
MSVPEHQNIRAVTDGRGTESFTFHAGLMSWKTFVADLQEYADQEDLEFEWSRKASKLAWLFGVEVTVTVTGRFSDVTNFVEYALARTRLWRDGDVAG